MKKQESTKSFAIAGIILGCVGFIFAVVTVISAIYMQESGMYDEIMRQYMDALGIEDNCAIEIVNGLITRSITAGGKAYQIKNEGGTLVKTVI